MSNPSPVTNRPMRTRRLSNVKHQPEHTKVGYQILLGNLNQAIKDAGLTKKEFAALVGMPYVICADRLRGHLNITIDELYVFAEALNIPMDTLYEGVEETIEPNDLVVSVPDMVRACMALRRATGSAISDHLKMNLVSYQARLRGAIPFRSHELVEIARFLSVPLHWFFYGIDNVHIVAAAGNDANVRRGD